MLWCSQFPNKDFKLGFYFFECNKLSSQCLINPISKVSVKSISVVFFLLVYHSWNLLSPSACSPCVLDNAVEIWWPKMMVSSSRKFHSLLPGTIQFGTTLILNQSFMFSGFLRWCKTGTPLPLRHSPSRLQLEVGRFILVSSPGQPQDLTSVTPAPHNYQKHNSSFSAVP